MKSSISRQLVQMKATGLNKLLWFVVKPGCNYTTMDSFAQHVTPAHRIHLCDPWELFSQLLPNSPWSQFQFAAPTSTWLAIGNLISDVPPVWGGWVQSWNNRWVVAGGRKKNCSKQTKVAFFFVCVWKEHSRSILSNYFTRVPEEI